MVPHTLQTNHCQGRCSRLHGPTSTSSSRPAAILRRETQQCRRSTATRQPLPQARVTKPGGGSVQQHIKPRVSSSCQNGPRAATGCHISSSSSSAPACTACQDSGSHPTASQGPRGRSRFVGSRIGGISLKQAAELKHQQHAAAKAAPAAYASCAQWLPAAAALLPPPGPASVRRSHTTTTFLRGSGGAASDTQG